MPEYLAPRVYVEEVDTGSKPIEGVSTSTAGVVGVTERGPTDVPILVTSTGEFTRWFGGQLPASEFPKYRHLPHAVEGFFTNGGKRLFVVRVADDSTATAETELFHVAGSTAVETRLVASAPTGVGTVFVLDNALAAGTSATWVRVGDGSTAEYRRLAGPPANAPCVTVWPPL